MRKGTSKVLMGLILGGVLVGACEVQAITCSKEVAEREFKVYFSHFMQARQNFDQTSNQTSNQTLPFQIFEVRPIKLSDQTLCEVVFSFSGVQGLKNIAYLGDRYLILGSLMVREGDVVKHITHERMNEVNREYFEEMRRRAEDERRVMEDRVRSEHERVLAGVRGLDLGKLGDIEVGGGGGVEFVVFVDMLCPYCKRVVEYLDEEMRRGKAFRVRYVLVSVFGERSLKSAAGVICSGGSNEERMRVLRGGGEGKVCESGMERVRRNTEEFRRVGAYGVPLIVVLEGGSVVDVVLGADIGKIEGYIERGERVKK
ncbi:MAG: hypothetical protein QXT86_10910 [Archaeoglobaceae archaeon]